MSSSRFLAIARQHLAVGTSLFALLVNLGAPVSAAAQEPAKHPSTATPASTGHAAGGRLLTRVPRLRALTPARPGRIRGL